jgi:hypothetical protein
MKMDQSILFLPVGSGAPDEEQAKGDSGDAHDFSTRGYLPGISMGERKSRMHPA